MNKKKALGKYLTVLFITILVIAIVWVITKTPPDKSYLLGNPCVVPCWQGIVPGETELETALTIIDQLQLVKQESIDVYEEKSVSYRFTGGGSGTLRLQNSVVYRIEIRPDYKLTLKEIVTHFGPPDFVVVSNNSVEFFCYSVNIFYLTGIWVQTGVCKINSNLYTVLEYAAKVSGDMEVNRLTFFSPQGDLEQLLLGSLRFRPGIAAKVTQYAMPWKGFGFYYLSPYLLI